MEKIYIANNGVKTRVVIMDKNEQVISDSTIRTNAKLMDNNYTVDYDTIAKLCDMTVTELKREYTLDKTESGRAGGVCGADWVLTYAEFSKIAKRKRNSLDRLLEAIENGEIRI